MVVHGLIRTAAVAAVAVAAVVGMRLLLGPWAAAMALAAVGVAGLVVGWASVEARAFDRRHPLVVRDGAAHRDHVAFARALTAVAAAYLAECEREANR